MSPDLHAYEVEVDLELIGDVEGGLLLFFNSALSRDGDHRRRDAQLTRAESARTGASPRRRPGAIELRLVNDHHIVSGWYRLPGGEWTRHAIRYETSGFHANTIGDLLSLRPAVYAAGAGAVRLHRIGVQPLGAESKKTPSSLYAVTLGSRSVTAVPRGMAPRRARAG